MLILKKNDGESTRDAVARTAKKFGNTDATMTAIIVADYQRNLDEGMSENDAALDTLFGWDIEGDYYEEVEDDYNEQWGFPKKEKA